MKPLSDMSEPLADHNGASAAPGGPLAREALALGAFDHVVARLPGFRSRSGQREMAAHIPDTLITVD